MRHRTGEARDRVVSEARNRVVSEAHEIHHEPENAHLENLKSEAVFEPKNKETVRTQSYSRCGMD